MNFEVADMITDTFVAIYMRFLEVEKKTTVDIELSTSVFVGLGSIPDNISTEILSRLDMKSLMRSKCVCKSWRSLISNDAFLKCKFPTILFAQRHENWPCPHEKMLSYDHMFSNFRLPHVKNTTSLVVEGSDNGILCLSEYSTNTTIYLWNPKTREVKKIPSPSCRFWQNCKFRVGLGYDPSTNDFKVIRVSRSFFQHEVLDSFLGNLFRSCCNRVLVYSLRRNSWKMVEMSNMFPSASRLYTFKNYDCSVVVNGSIHWSLTYFEEEPPRGKITYKFGILAFDLKAEVFKLIKSPQQVKECSKQSIGKLYENLSSMTCKTPGLIEIWVMKEYGVLDSWTKQVKVDLTKCSMKSSVPFPQPSAFHKWLPFLHPYKQLYPTEFGYNGHVLISSVSHGLFWCNPYTNNLEHFSPKMSIVGFTNYVESDYLLS